VEVGGDGDASEGGEEPGLVLMMPNCTAEC
jgi:hypothetical protein